MGCYKLSKSTMEKFGTLIFLITIGLSLSDKFYINNHEFAFDGHKSGLCFTHKGELRDNLMNGIVPMYFKISENSAFYAIFHYKQNNFAAAVAVQMFRVALENIQRSSYDDPTPVDWKSFLEHGLKKIDHRLMQNDITGVRAESETKVLIAIVDGYKVILAEIGDMRMVMFGNAVQNMKYEPWFMTTGLLNVLGGKTSKQKDLKIRGVAKVIEFHDMKYIVLGTKSLWFLSEDQIALTVLENAKDLKRAAQEITNSVMMPFEEKDNGVIVIDINPTREKVKEEDNSFISKLCGCLNSR